MNLMSIARLLLLFGAILLVTGGLLYLAARANLPLGRLPGDIRIQTGNTTCIFPLVTSILLSIVLTVVLNLIIRLMNR